MDDLERVFLRDHDEIVHRVSGFEANDMTYCGRFVDMLVVRHLRKGRRSRGPATCMLCIDRENSIENEPVWHVVNVDSYGVQTWGTAPWTEDDDDEG